MRKLLMISMLIATLNLTGCATMVKGYVWVYEKVYGIPEEPKNETTVDKRSDLSIKK
jgi:hypothetical protein